MVNPLALVVAVAASQVSGRKLANTCTARKCTASLNTFLTGKVSDILSSQSLTAACGNVVELASTLGSTCQADLTSVGPSCPCSAACTSALEGLQPGCFDAVKDYLCTIVPEAEAQGVDLYSILEATTMQCYSSGAATSTFSCGPGVVPKQVGPSTDCAALTSALPRAPAAAAPAPKTPAAAAMTPAPPAVPIQPAAVPAGRQGGPQAVQAPVMPAPAPSVPATPAVASPAVPVQPTATGATAAGQCEEAECRSGLTEFLESRGTALISQLGDCGDVIAIGTALLDSCKGDLAATGKACQCSDACATAVATVPEACVANLRTFMCNNNAVARSSGVELVATLEDLLGRCYAAPQQPLPPAPPACKNVTPFVAQDVCGQGKQLAPIQDEGGSGGFWKWLGAAVVAILPCL